jgi:isocitrate dehydrogenase
MKKSVFNIKEKVSVAEIEVGEITVKFSAMTYEKALHVAVSKTSNSLTKLRKMNVTKGQNITDEEFKKKAEKITAESIVEAQTMTATGNPKMGRVVLQELLSDDNFQEINVLLHESNEFVYQENVTNLFKLMNAEYDKLAKELKEELEEVSDGESTEKK